MDDKLKMSRKQERDVAERFGGKVVSQSGAGWIRKGDVTTPTELIECKITQKASFSLKVKDLIQAWLHACASGRRMVFAIEYKETETNRYTRKQRYIVLQEDDYHADQEELERLRVIVSGLGEWAGF